MSKSYPNNTILIILIAVMPLWLSIAEVHKFYVSVTQIDYVEEQKSVQIISRVFLDDLEDALNERFNESIRISSDESDTTYDTYIEDYFKSKIGITINGKVQKLEFIGKSLDLDMMVVYLEIPAIQSIKTIDIKNTVLIEIFEEQQNIIRTNINNVKKSFILVSQDRNRMLNF